MFKKSYYFKPSAYGKALDYFNGDEDKLIEFEDMLEELIDTYAEIEDIISARNKVTDVAEMCEIEDNPNISTYLMELNVDIKESESELKEIYNNLKSDLEHLRQHLRWKYKNLLEEIENYIDNIKDCL